MGLQHYQGSDIRNKRNLQKNADKFVYEYKGKVIEVTGKIVNGVLNISDAWVKYK